MSHSSPRSSVNLLDEAMARRVARLVIPSHARTDPWRAAELQRGVHADMPAIDRAARAWSGLGAELSPTTVRVVSRVGWVDSNLAALRGVFGPLADKMRGNRVVAARVLGAQVGAVLGLLSTKVLGQFVLPLSQDESGDDGHGGQLLVVGPNLLDLAEERGELAEGIRRAVLLHEVTHRLQFDGVTWLGDHLRGLLDRYLEHARLDPGVLLEAAGRLPGAVAEARSTGSPQPIIESVLTPPQVEVVRDAQGLMSLLEGHGNAAMFLAADGLLDDPDGVRAALRNRRSDVTSKVLTAVAGLEMKRRQYREGEAFVHAVVDAAGIDGLNRAFAAPANLPTAEEVVEPEAWLARVGVQAG